MNNSTGLIFVHGLLGTSQGEKARFLHQIFPDILIPDFSGSLMERMESLEKILDDRSQWKIIGSSFGGLMGAIFTCQNPELVERLILLAPALTWQEFSDNLPQPVSTPVTIYHGSRDKIISAAAVQEIAEMIFPNLEFHLVDDDHGLYETVKKLDWHTLLDFGEK